MVIHTLDLLCTITFTSLLDMIDRPWFSTYHLLAHYFSNQPRFALSQQRQQLLPITHRMVHDPELLISIRPQRIERMQHCLHRLKGIDLSL